VSDTEPKRALGIDFGSRRIGLAVSDQTRTLATGYTTIENNDEASGNIARIVDEKNIDVIVFGLPVSIEGGDSRKAEEVKRFAADVGKVVNVPIVFHDESFTSRDAMETMIAMNTKRKQRRDKGRIDSMAAALILQSYLDIKQHKSERP